MSIKGNLDHFIIINQEREPNWSIFESALKGNNNLEKVDYEQIVHLIQQNKVEINCEDNESDFSSQYNEREQHSSSNTSQLQKRSSTFLSEVSQGISKVLLEKKVAHLVEQ